MMLRKVLVNENTNDKCTLKNHILTIYDSKVLIDVLPQNKSHGIVMSFLWQRYNKHFLYFCLDLSDIKRTSKVIIIWRFENVCVCVMYDP